MTDDALIDVKTSIAEWLLKLARLVTDDDVLIGAEIGVKQGLLSRELLAHDDALTLWMVDHWQPSKPDCDYVASGDPAANADAGEIAGWQTAAEELTAPFVNRRRIVVSDSVKAARSVAAGTFDFVFLDADHSFVARLADLRAWFPLVRPGGLVAGGLWTSAFGGDSCARAVCAFIDERKLVADILHGPAKTWAFFKPEGAPNA